MKKLTLHYWEIPHVYLRLTPAFWTEFLQIRIKNKDSWRLLEKKFKIERKALFNYRNSGARTKKYLTLRNLQKILEYMDKKNAVYLRQIEQKNLVCEIRYGHRGKVISNPRLPIDFDDPNWAKIAGAILTDGCVQKDGKVYFINKNLLLIKKLIALINQTVGEFDSPIQKFKRGKNYWYRVQFPKYLGQVLINGLNWKAGNKVMENTPIPEYITNLHTGDAKGRRYLASFLRWAFTCDGWVNTYANSIGISFNVDVTNLPESMVKAHENAPNLLLGIRKCLLNSGVKVGNPHFMNLRQRMDGVSAKWCIEFQSKTSLKVFYYDIGFEQENKTTKLRNIVKQFGGG